MPAHGLLLAAGAGRRMGQPKALVRDADGTAWLLRSVDVLRAGGCEGVTVVLGAAADEAEELLRSSAAPDADVAVIRADDWATGMGASLRAGLRALTDGSSSAALVHLVDLPDVGADVIARVVGATGARATALARASYDGKPGHPVLLGRDHWAPIIAAADGDRGARDYLATHAPLLVSCDDLATGADVDRR